ncbi:MAG: hypothetical protein Q4B90_07165 [Eubacteriales bacterium]|nr:hypothetical protein [Eubacteriales bacterium]
MEKKQVQTMLFQVLNEKENDEIVTLALPEKEQEIWIQFRDGTKYKICIEDTKEVF